MDTLVMLSGGVDSAGALYNLLTKSDDRIWVHHVYLDHRRNRAREEQVAVNKIKQWLRTNTRSFYSSENTFSYPFHIGANPSDMSVLGFIAGTMVCTIFDRYKVNFDRVMFGHTLVEARSPSATRRKQHLTNFFNFTIQEHITNEEWYADVTYPTLEFPSFNIEKKTLADNMPIELLEMCWSCLSPTIPFTPCGICTSCQDIINIGYFDTVSKQVKEQPI
ncbi:MAG: hypothetical protein HC836_44590 [Richelia sp. RM2_1_2]|nr:hypothetical protein [Richelia sp. RM2_1_2]